jgi:hypothetical protein
MTEKGYLEIQLDDVKLASFYSNKEVYAELFNLIEN